MKILYLIHQFYPEYYTGTEKFVFNLATMMQNFGNKVKVITYSFYNNSFYDKKFGEILAKEFMYKGIPILAFKYENPPVDLHFALKDERLAKLAKNIIKKELPDIVHIGHPMRVHELALASQSLNIPYVITLTDFWLMCPKVNLITSTGDLCKGPEGDSTCQSLCPEFTPQVIGQRLKLAKNFLFKANVVVSPSRFLASLFLKENKSLDLKIVNHGLSFMNLKKNRKAYKREDKLTFCYAGSLNYHKGVHILLEAFKKMRVNHTFLKIYGSGPDKNYVEKMKKVAGKDSRIEFCGTYSFEQIGDVFEGIDVLIIPSIVYESYSLTLHEALACNVPVITSNIGGIAEKISDGFNGYTFKVGDSEHLRIIIETIAADPEMLNKLKENITKIMIPTIEQEAYEYYRIYKNIANKQLLVSQSHVSSGL